MPHDRRPDDPDDAPVLHERRAGLWWDHTGRPGAESRFARAHGAQTAADSLGGVNITALKEANT